MSSTNTDDQLEEQRAEQARIEALANWHSYGRAPWLELDPDRKPTLSTDWKTEPFSTPQTAPWYLPLSMTKLKGLLLGSMPQAMEDKWFVYCDVPKDENGKQVTTMYHFRSWTGFRIAEARIVIEPENDLALITQLTYETDTEKIRGATEQSAKDSFLSVCKYILGVDLNE